MEEKDCIYCLALKNREPILKCIAPYKLGDERDPYYPKDLLRNPIIDLEESQNLLLCLQPEDSINCPVKKYYESDLFHKSDGTKSLGNYLKERGY